MKKRVLSLLLAVMMVCALLPTAAFATEYDVTEVLVQGTYDEVEEFRDGLARVKKSGKYGYINTQGKIVLPCVYSELGYFDNGLASVKKDGKYGFINIQGFEVVPCVYEAVTDFSDGFAKVKKDGKWGCVNAQGELAVSCAYDVINTYYNDGVGRWFFDDLAVVKKNGKYGYVNTQGVEVIACVYDSASIFENGVATIGKDGYSYTINTQGQVVDEPLINGVRRVRENGKWGLVNAMGEVVVPCQYDTLYFSDGMVCVSENGKYGVLNTRGEMIASCQYDDYIHFNEGFASVSKNGKYGAINTEGEMIVSCQYDCGIYFYEGLAMVSKDYKYGYINAQGKQIVSCQYDDATRFEDGYAIVMKNGKSAGWKYGIIDTQGQLIVPCTTYSWIGGFYEDLSRVSIENDEKWGYINTQGELVIPCTYEYVTDFSGGLALVEKNGKWGLIDTRGKTVIDCTYSDFNDFVDGFATAKKNGKWYILSGSKYEVALPTGNTILVDGVETIPAAYMITDNNYFKLRDVAALLNGTKAQFSIGWDSVTGAITITTGKAYTAVGGELAGAPTSVANAYESQSTIYINGQKADLTAYLINDNNYFKLRDLGAALGFNVKWDGTKGAVLIESDKPYSDAN